MTLVKSHSFEHATSTTLPSHETYHIDVGLAFSVPAVDIIQIAARCDEYDAAETFDRTVVSIAEVLSDMVQNADKEAAKRERMERLMDADCSTQ